MAKNRPPQVTVFSTQRKPGEFFCASESSCVRPPLDCLEGFSAFLADEGLLGCLSREAASVFLGGNAAKMVEVFGTLLLAMLYGQRGYARMDALRWDAASPGGLGFSKTATGSRVRRALDALGSDWSRKRLRETWETRLEGAWILDLHATLKTTRCEEGSGKRLVHHTCWNAAQRLCLDVQVEPGPAEFGASGVWELIDSLPTASLPHAVRGGGEYASEENLCAAEVRGMPYLFELPASALSGELLTTAATSQSRMECGGGFSATEAMLQLKGWSRMRRVVFVRSGVASVVGLVTSLRAGMDEVLRLHDERAIAGNPFDPSSEQWAWVGFSTTKRESSQTAAQVLATFHNWWSLYFTACRSEVACKLVAGQCAERAITPPLLLLRERGQGILLTIVAGLLLAFLATGISVTVNQVTEDLRALEEAIETDAPSVLAPMEPRQPDAGTEALGGAQNEALSPLPDPNVDDMPPLDGQEISPVEVPVEAAGRLWRLRPILSTGVTYDDNIFITNTDRKGDLIYNVCAGLAFEIGDYRDLEDNYLMLQYVATGYLFTRYSTQNSVNQNASFIGQYRFSQLAVKAQSTYQYLNGAQREVGAFTTSSIWSNALSFDYNYSTKTDVFLEFNVNTNSYPRNLSSNTCAAQTGFNYSLFPKTKIGLQGILGRTQTEGSPDMWYKTINLRGSYDLTGKLVIKASGGMQLNDYIGGGEAPRSLFVCSLGSEYLIFPRTLMTIVGYRNLQSSASILGQDYVATGGEIGFKQTIDPKFTLSLATGYENDSYVANTTATSATRVDNFLFIRPSISYNFMKYLKASLSYEYRANVSTAPVDSWTNNRMSFDISANF